MTGMCIIFNFFAKIGALTNFLPGLSLNLDHLDLCLPSSWDNRWELLLLAKLYPY
jgi:hypothetical protein